MMTMFVEYVLILNRRSSVLQVYPDIDLLVRSDYKYSGSLSMTLTVDLYLC